MKKKAIAASALTAMALFGASQQAQANAVLIPFVQGGNGWATVLTYIAMNPNFTIAPPPPKGWLHITYMYKSDVTNPSAACEHFNHYVESSVTDVTSCLITGSGTWSNGLFNDVDYGTLPESPCFDAPIRGAGYVVIDDLNPGVNDPDFGISAEAVIFNAATGFIYSQRAVEMNHDAGGAVNDIFNFNTVYTNTIRAYDSSAGIVLGERHRYIDASAGSTIAATHVFPGRVPPLPGNVAVNSNLYVIAANLAGTQEAGDAPTTVNMVDVNYNASVQLTAARDAFDAYLGGFYDRVERSYSMSRTQNVVCLASLPFESIVTGSGWNVLNQNGGWLNVRVGCLESENNVVGSCNRNAAGRELGDAAIIYKLDSSSPYGMVVTPLSPKIYIR